MEISEIKKELMEVSEMVRMKIVEYLQRDTFAGQNLTYRSAETRRTLQNVRDALENLINNIEEQS